VKIVADESAAKQIVTRLRAKGHDDVLYVAELDPRIDDEAVLDRSRQANAILLTAEKDFGELVLRRPLVHSGALLIRVVGLKPEAKAEIVATTALDQNAE
jgi:predicted nuclease of predicted toxin-antitoxin system